MPKSIEKDYYIWRFLSQKSTTKSEAYHAIRQIQNLNKKLKKAYRKKTGLSTKNIKYQKEFTPDHIWKRRSKANRNFKKGLKLLQQNRAKKAIPYFKVAQQHYIRQYERDKATFWLYLSSKNKSYLKTLLESPHPNIYTLSAADIKNKAYPKTITESFWNDTTDGFDVEDPIAWAKVKHLMKKSDDIDALAENYESKACIGIYTYLKAKACNETKSYFPMPYPKSMEGMTPERKALIYAIARQESRFVPASVSRSFALGMMQFMPFLIKDVAKAKGEKIDYDDIFNPHKAIKYADYHLDYLTRYLYHPLFIAYAYNAGIGFTKRHITKPHYFRKGLYEPYMSIEKMKNYEAREYGKKVLTNYVIYLNKLGVNSRISSFLQTLDTPSKTDRFRK